jgi:peptide/nickel transport system substrate-binding protein
MKILRFGFLFALLSIVALPTPAQTPTRLVIGIADEPSILDVQQAFGTNFATTDLITQSLVWYSLESSDVLVPDIVESYAFSPDGLTITWVLPEGYTFSNGVPLDAAAVQASIERYRAISPYSSDWGELESMRVVDTRTLETTFMIPPAFMSPVFSSGFGAPFDVTTAQAVGDEAFASAPIASGPFVLAEWVRGTEMRLTRNDNYRTNLPFVTNKGPALIDEVLVRFIPDSLTLIAELEAGNIDLVYNVPSSAVASLQDNPDISITSVLYAGYQGLMFNNTRPPFNNLAFRQALAAAINRDILAQVLEETVVPQRAFLSATQVSYDETIAAYAEAAHPTDPARARQLLTDAGFVDTDGDGIVEFEGAPLRLQLLIASDDSKQVATSVILQAMLQQVGIGIDIVQFQQSFIYDQMTTGDYDLAFGGYNWWDPDIMIYVFTDEGRNWPSYQNEEVDRLLREGRGIIDPDARRAVYSRVQQILIDDVAAIPLWTELTFVAHRSTVTGLIVHPITSHLFLNDVTVTR